MSVQTLFSVTWLVWYVTWLAGVVWSGRTKVQMKTDMSGPHRMVAGIGSVLLLWTSGVGRPAFGLGFLGAFSQRLWVAPVWSGCTLYGLLLCAFGFCWWARVHLGPLWSGFVTLKEDHHIVDTGPYGLVRHPIYTGVMAAALVTAMERASLCSILGFVMVSLGFALVAGMEETFLKAQLGAEAYDAYSRRVPMLVPLTR